MGGRLVAQRERVQVAGEAQRALGDGGPPGELQERPDFRFDVLDELSVVPGRELGLDTDGARRCVRVLIDQIALLAPKVSDALVGAGKADERPRRGVEPDGSRRDYPVPAVPPRRFGFRANHARAPWPFPNT
jgi:hypothetical protein